MITEEEIVAVGHTGKTHGVQGEIVAEFDVEFDVEKCAYFVFDIDGIFVPFFISSLRSKSDVSVLLKFDGIADEKHARELCNKQIFVKRELIVQSDELSLNYFIGFTVVDAVKGVVGVIDDVDDSTENALFAIGDALIPVCDEFIANINHEKRVITMNLPEGLV